MKKNCTALLILFSISIYAQNYSRVNILGNPEKLHSTLAQKGIILDHYSSNSKGILVEISEDEISLLQKNNFPFEVVIKNMSEFYQKRNENDQLNKTESSANCNVPGVSKPNHFHLGSMGGFFTLTEMQTILDSMALLYPNLITVKQPISSTQSFEGRPIWYVKISDNPNQDENEPEVLYTALHHAREPQSLSQLIFYMWHLLENYSSNPEVKATLDNTELFFIPCINPDGYEYNKLTNPNGGGMWRRNRRLNQDNTFGVDLNRNYGFNWGYDNTGSSPFTNNDTYRGTGPFSEPETQAVRNFCNTRQFKAALNAHTYGNHLISPWGYLQTYVTNDSTTFDNWAGHLTRQSRYTFGTSYQTLFYMVNGGSDDWMYGEQNTKGKIFAFTPESGAFNDGFWPQSSRIIDLCKFTFYQNFELAKLAVAHVELEDKRDYYLSASGYIPYQMKQLGLSPNNFTVSLITIANGFTTVGAPKIYTPLALNQIKIDSISYQLNSNLVSGQKIKYVLKMDNGLIATHDTITKMVGNATTLFYDDCSILSTNFNEIGGNWAVNNYSDYVSFPACFEDNIGNYLPNQDKELVMNNSLSLTNATHALLQYYVKYNFEKEWDFAQLLISIDNGVTFNPICAPHKTSPLSYDGQDPIYDGRQKDWVKEEIDLSSYLGKNIILKFLMTSDGGSQKSGIYLDDIWIRKLSTQTNGAGLTTTLISNSNFEVFPNPTSDKVFIKVPNSENNHIELFNLLGEKILSENFNSIHHTLETKNLSNGVYFIKIVSINSEFTSKIIVHH